MPPRKRKRQTRLTFEAGDAPQSPDQNGPSTARVRYTTAPAPPPLSSPLKPMSLPRRGGGQTVIDESFNGGTASGNRKTRLSASFMPKLSQRPKVAAAVDSSEEEAADEGAVERNDSSDDEDTLPPIAGLAAPKSSQSVSSRLKQTVLSSSSSSSSDNDDSDKGGKDDEDEAPVPSSARRRKPPVLQLDPDSDDDLIVLSPAKRQRTSRPKARVASSGSDSDAQPARSPQKPARRLRAGKASQQPPPSSPSKRPQGHRTEKQKKMELLRRRRAGEKIDRLTSSESEADDNGERRGLYDTDSEEELQVLKEFEDDEEEEEEEAAEAPPLGSKKAKKSKKSEKERKKKEKEKKRKKKSKKSRNAESGEERDSDMDSFIDSDDSGPLGAPDVAIPLEFTAQAHKPLKEQFPYVVEWLVHNRINPAFARDDPVYRNAWRKLNDEYNGLASSKFSSSAWRPDFARTLRARPRIDAYEMDTNDDDRLRTCEACGRSKHPATWRLVFQGKPYSKETLQEIESDSSDSDDDNDDDNASIDSQGHPLPAATKEWVVGSTCKSNAETAHVLLHWKHALQEWVEDRLELDGWTTAARVAERERLKPRRRRKLADAIVDGLRDGRVIAALYGDFKQNLEDARNKTTRGNGRWQ